MRNKKVDYFERILRLFLSNDDIPEKISIQVAEWLTNGKDCKEKDMAMRRLFYEALDSPTGRVRPMDITKTHKLL